MPWIPHVMILDDDPRVLESLVPGFVMELGRGLSQSREVAAALRRGASRDDARGPVRVRVSAHGFESDRVRSYAARPPFEVHLHLVRERGGTFDLARRLLNQQPFAAVVSDQRFSDDAGGQRAGQYFVAEAARIHPEVQGLLYSAYPRPDDFPADRFIRKGAGGPKGADDLAEQVVRAIERHLADHSARAFAAAIGDRGLVYQSDAFGEVLAQLFDLARLIGSGDAPPSARSRRPLPCLLIDGESGTGKRGLAEVFHAASDRRSAPLVVASCSELTNETLLRSILFGHKRGAFTDAREDRPGLVTAAGKGVLLLDDVHRLPAPCSAILHSFLEDGEYGRLGEEEVRRRAECAVVLTVETGPWRERRQSGELPVAFLARVERLLVTVPPLRDRPDDIEAQARWLTRTLSAELGADIALDDDAVSRLRGLPFDESNSRELRNLIERAVYRHYREADLLCWEHLAPFVSPIDRTAALSPPASPVDRKIAAPPPSPASAPNDWQRRLRALAAKILAKGADLPPEEARLAADALFDEIFPLAWDAIQASRHAQAGRPPLPLPLWEDLWRCFAVSWLGGPSPAEKELGIPANTLRQWINDRESR
ncbi:sigma-54-dependent transcriptional regulator [Tautonia sociabilis]|uniref:Sigma-54-dependent Fis family transcriptional regulator n=1 Tax=Tautonia sociabilis TaxID=2080755 RepID=A0A432MPC1_9BACT|nr:sigma 54-interacting transcriptional regulator [Tautonia sociabilis]RUL89303.1 sigma-54-dependent Fis family transcriptional regulator [Tautonia sociabilis]